MKINRSAATKSLTVIASLFLAGSLASCDAAAQADATRQSYPLTSELRELLEPMAAEAQHAA